MLPVTLLAVLAASPAAAQELACPDDYTAKTFRDALDQAQQAFDQADLSYANKVLSEAHDQVVCLPTLVETEDLARFARQRALLAFFHQDEATAIRWGHLARQTAPDLPWPKPFGPDHPFREMVDGATRPQLGGPDGNLVVPKKGAVFMSGDLLLAPKAHAEVPQLVQVFDKNITIIEAFWQDGAAFRTDMVDAAAPVPEPPKWWGPDGIVEDGQKPPKDKPPKDKPPNDKPPKDKPPKDKPIKDKPPKEPRDGTINVLRLAIGGGLALAAGGLYTVAFINTAGLPKREGDALASGRTLSNTLVLTSGVVGLAAIGVGVTAFISDDGGHIGMSFRF